MIYANGKCMPFSKNASIVLNVTCRKISQMEKKMIENTNYNKLNKLIYFKVGYATILITNLITNV